MICLRHFQSFTPHRFEPIKTIKTRSCVVVCAAKGPRPRYPRVWKRNKKIGTISKSNKLVNSIKELSNVKEEVYGALDSFIAWELEFPLITVKKALKTLEYEKEWKRIIKVIKWMLSKGQGRTMGTYLTLINALAEDGRLDEVEELWTKLFSQYLESMPRIFFNKMVGIYYQREMHDKMFEIFADMEELGVKPSTAIVNMMGDVFLKLGMEDKYKKLKRKYPPPKWEYRYVKGKRVRFRAKHYDQVDGSDRGEDGNEEDPSDSIESGDESESKAEANAGESETDKINSSDSTEVDVEAGHSVDGMVSTQAICSSRVMGGIDT